jgi:hypothetical protein
MNSEVRGILLELHRQAEDEALFRSRKTDVTLTDLKHGFNGACADAGLDDFRLHDLWPMYSLLSFVIHPATYLIVHRTALCKIVGKNNDRAKYRRIRSTESNSGGGLELTTSG